MRDPRAVTGKPGLGRWAEKHLANRRCGCCSGSAWRPAPSHCWKPPAVAPAGGGRLRSATASTGRCWLVAAHGHRSSYVANLTASPRCRVKVGRHWRAGIASFVEDDALARRARLDQANGITGRLDGLAFRATATRPVTIRIDLDPLQAAGGHWPECRRPD